MDKVKIAVVAAGVAALAGGGTAIAAKGHDSGRGGGLRLGAPAMRLHAGGLGLDAAATYLGTTADALRTQLESGKTLAQIANATSGKSAQGLVDALVAAAKAKLGPNAPADLTQRITDMVDGVHDMHGMDGMHGMRGGPFELRAAAAYLGIGEESLRSQLESGKTLAQIANATSGKSAQGLIDALVADARTRITKLVNGS
jgi:hypothetical protein